MCVACGSSAFPRRTLAALLRFLRVSERLSYVFARSVAPRSMSPIEVSPDSISNRSLLRLECLDSLNGHSKTPRALNPTVHDLSSEIGVRHLFPDPRPRRDLLR